MDILEYQTSDIKVPCLPLGMMLIAFHTSHSLHTKGPKVIQNNPDHKQNLSTDMNSIQKPLNKNEKELPKQT